MGSNTHDAAPPDSVHWHAACAWFFRLGRSSLLAFLLVCALLLPSGLHQARAAGTAPNGPGYSSIWAPSNKAFLGTAANTTSDVWFTGYNGIISEVFFPTADTANTTDLQFLIGDSGHTWVDEEKVATTSTVQLYNAHSLAWQVTNTAKNGRYRITKIIYTDPARNSLIQQVTFTALSGTLSNYLLYVLYNPAIHNAGNNNTSSTQTYNGRTMLVTTDSSGNYASALAASIPYVSGMTSSGFVGVNDGWTDLKASSNCGSSTCPDYTMNYTYSLASNGNTAQTGLLDLSNGGSVNTSTATSITFNLVLSFGQTSGSTAAATVAEQTLNATLSDTSNMLATYVAQWNSFDNNLTSPPAVGSTTAIQQARQQEYYLAANVLKASQDKQTGAFVAGLGVPWGDSNGDSDAGYHLVWERDMYKIASALIVAGDSADALRAVQWAFNTQQQSDGHFPQNSYVNGTPYWNGIQMDEQAFPIILAWKLGLTDNSTFVNHIKKAADYIVNNGPRTGQERWEENSGYSPSTIAAEIAGLLCAADIARVNGDTTDQTRYTNVADYYQGMVQNWTFTTTGPLGGGYYFERIDGNGNPNDGASITIANGGGTYDERTIVDAGFLELVRLGVMPANSPYITLSLPVIDATIKETINGYPYWFRYNHDGYGEHSDGSNYNGTGIGRLWPVLTAERGIYTIAAGGDADLYLSALMAAANSSGMIPEQIWDTAAPSGYTPGTPTKSMNPLNWAMGEYIVLLFSEANHRVVDMPSITYSRYVTNAYQPHSGWVVDYDPNQLHPGKALTIYYNGWLASHTHVYIRWGENGWQNIPPDAALVKRSDGFWQVTISVPTDATQINFAFHDDANNWDNNGGGNWNVPITA
ncbi:MAG: amylase [Thermogemmatispora sp.]|uniref:glycoside hydrolase family 15 protein n=1 Tax=Thermogemmatispora sp. TaxID=1968838 RepID=UPI0019F49E1D|nr:glycoside hydrolase family 15 protein [Thermogemmatispora sp.]MBE3567640.1 amylase [Thermogemmatispora sp.]